MTRPQPEEGGFSLSPGALRLIEWLEGAAALALVIMMAVTVVDVLMRNAFNRPIAGVIELVKILMAYLVFLAIPQAFLHRRHVQVDVIDHLVGPRPLLWTEVLGEACGIALLAVMLAVMWGETGDAHEMGDVTSDLMVPITVIWVPLLAGTLCSLLAVLTLMWSDVQRLLRLRGDGP